MASGNRNLIGAIEGGGTKFVCALNESPTETLERVEIPTRTPAVTLRACLDFFQAAMHRHGRIAALGIACFGPLQLRRDARDYGCLLGTPKQGWSGISVLAPFVETLRVPVALDTDVGAAARGELHFGAGRGLGSLAYVTVGTGVGGAVAPASAATRLMHAEMGHLIVRRDVHDKDFAGICPFHGDCLEGLASGPAIVARWGSDLSQLPEAHEGRHLIAGYLAQLAVSIALLHSPELIVFGGGVMRDARLLPLVRQQTGALLAGYLAPLRDETQLARFIQAPALTDHSALAGIAQMAVDSLERQQRHT